MSKKSVHFLLERNPCTARALTETPTCSPLGSLGYQGITFNHFDGFRLGRKYLRSLFVCFEAGLHTNTCTLFLTPLNKTISTPLVDLVNALCLSLFQLLLTVSKIFPTNLKIIKCHIHCKCCVCLFLSVYMFASVRVCVCVCVCACRGEWGKLSTRVS